MSERQDSQNPENGNFDGIPITPFGILFRRHWAKGTGVPFHAKTPGSETGWNQQLFLKVITKHLGTEPDWHTVRKWKDGGRPQERNKNAILETFFPKPRTVAAESARFRMDEAWNITAPEVAGKKNVFSDMRDDPDDWQLASPFTAMPRVVELSLHQPDPGNKGGYYVKATVRIDSEVHHDLSDGRGVLISLHEPILELSSPGFPKAEESLIGVRTPHKHFKRTSNNWTLAGTSKAKGEDLARDEYLALIKDDGSGKGPVTLMLKGTGKCFRVVLADEDGNPQLDSSLDITKSAIINALFGSKLEREEDGTIVVAKHTMIRKTKK